MYDEVDLMMHPAINKLLSVKWKLFGRRRAIIGNFWTVIHTLLATVLIFAVPYQPYDKQFIPVNEQVWKIILAVVFFILTFYFWIKVKNLIVVFFLFRGKTRWRKGRNSFGVCDNILPLYCIFSKRFWKTVSEGIWFFKNKDTFDLDLVFLFKVFLFNSISRSKP